MPSLFNQVIVEPLVVDDKKPAVPPIEPKPAAAKPAAAKPKAAAAKPASTAAKSAPAAKKTTSPKPPPPPSAPAADRPNPYVQSPPPSAPVAPQPYMNGPYVAPPAQGLSIASMVLGIVGLFLSFCYGAGFLASLAAVITGHLAVKRQPYAKGFWLTGIITGYIGLGLSVLWFIVLVFFVVLSAASGPFGYY